MFVIDPVIFTFFACLASYAGVVFLTAELWIKHSTKMIKDKEIFFLVTAFCWMGMLTLLVFRFIGFALCYLSRDSKQEREIKKLERTISHMKKKNELEAKLDKMISNF